MVEVESLKGLALQQIEDSLDNKNILKEVSLRFPSIYEEVKALEYAYLKENWASSQLHEILTGADILDITARCLRGDSCHEGILPAAR